MCAASQRGSRCWRKTLARYGQARPKRPLCVEAGTKGRVISRTDSNARVGGGLNALGAEGGAAEKLCTVSLPQPIWPQYGIDILLSGLPARQESLGPVSP
jgi:hypothetical protein